MNPYQHQISAPAGVQYNQHPQRSPSHTLPNPPISVPDEVIMGQPKGGTYPGFGRVCQQHPGGYSGENTLSNRVMSLDIEGTVILSKGKVKPPANHHCAAHRASIQN